MDTIISILFYGKKSRTTSDNLLPSFLRVTIDGKLFEIPACVTSLKALYPHEV
ncbi:hypothetical protein [Pontibacter toksunensis]|uniref:hypothetical protein n=1 Tax=Pontibacter toksunensis TaxID=1332631 RepID=UPI00366A608A